MMPNVSEAEWAFNAYEATRHRLPSPEFTNATRPVESLLDLADEIDVFLLDAFGVLNFGETAIPNAAAHIDALRAMGKRVKVVSNAAGYPKRVLLQRYETLGFSFGAQEVLSSREVLLKALKSQPPRRSGIMVSDGHGREELEHLAFDFLGDDPAVYDRVEQFIFLGSGHWSEARQCMLETSLKSNPRPVLVGNPDIVAPRDTGLSREPGHFAHRLADDIGVEPQFFGKPFGDVFTQALATGAQGVNRDRIVMVGDTLQTDILGGRAAGLKTALITGYGALRGMDAAQAIKASGITPDFIMKGP